MVSHEPGNDLVHLEPRGISGSGVDSIARKFDLSDFVAEISRVDDDLQRFSRVALRSPGFSGGGDFGEGRQTGKFLLVLARITDLGESLARFGRDAQDGVR